MSDSIRNRAADELAMARQAAAEEKVLAGLRANGTIESVLASIQIDLANGRLGQEEAEAMVRYAVWGQMPVVMLTRTRKQLSSMSRNSAESRHAGMALALDHLSIAPEVDPVPALVSRDAIRRREIDGASAAEADELHLRILSGAETANHLERLCDLRIEWVRLESASRDQDLEFGPLQALDPLVFKASLTPSIDFGRLGEATLGALINERRQQAFAVQEETKPRRGPAR
jgi:hypothetical protein